MTVEWAPLEPEPTGHNTLNYTEQGGEVTHIGGTLIIEEGAHVEALSLPSGRLQYQDDSIQYHNREPINCLRCILLFIHKTSKLLFWSSNHSKSLNSQDNSAMHPAL